MTKILDIINSHKEALRLAIDIIENLDEEIFTDMCIDKENLLFVLYDLDDGE